MTTKGMNFTKQARRKRSKRWFIIKGKDKTMIEWCALYGISQSTVSTRIKRGWPMDENLFQPSDPKYRNTRCKERLAHLGVHGIQA